MQGRSPFAPLKRRRAGARCGPDWSARPGLLRRQRASRPGRKGRKIPDRPAGTMGGGRDDSAHGADPNTVFNGQGEREPGQCFPAVVTRGESASALIAAGQSPTSSSERTTDHQSPFLAINCTSTASQMAGSGRGSPAFRQQRRAAFFRRRTSRLCIAKQKSRPPPSSAMLRP